jgi:roadblock/LC7 domain-containing protein
MKRIVRAAALLLLLTLTAALFTACGAKPAREPGISALTDAIDASIGNDGSMIAVDKDYVKGAMKMDVTPYAGWCVKINAYGANVDEYGVFRGADKAQTAEIKKAVEEYLAMRVDSWMDAYMPEEKPKVTNAELRTEGNYVCYCILSDEEKSAAFKAFEDSFKA